MKTYSIVRDIAFVLAFSFLIIQLVVTQLRVKAVEEQFKAVLQQK